MRILKRKIALAKASKTNNKKACTSKTKQQTSFIVENLQTLTTSYITKETNTMRTPKRRNRSSNVILTPETSRATKNIVKNFGKAICTFSSSNLALPYLNCLIEKEGIEIQDFVNYVLNMKGKIDGLFHFRSLLLMGENDTEIVRKCKRIFKEMSEIFIKYFSVNWIFHSKVFHKTAHLKFRYKMLRRIQCPELFTYLNNSKRRTDS